MRDRGRVNSRTVILWFLLFTSVSISIGAAGCSAPKPAAEQPAQGPKRYVLTGRVVSIDKAKLQVTVDGADIPDFMSAMTMGYDAILFHRKIRSRRTSW
ncbi:MAG: hypothetical protein LAO08_14590 [Acidobacteriia bacterium]|nr:hypothetical protein [Terriglobia bacterium]